MNLDEFRAKIDGLDRQIVELLNQRTRMAQEIGLEKKKDAAVVFVPGREKDVYAKVAGLNQGPLSERHVRAIYREIMSASKSLEGDVHIAFLGPRATFSHQAAMSCFGNSVQYVPCASFFDVFDLVEKRHAQHGVVPIENSIEGGVSPVQDLLRNTSLKIYAEIYIPVAHAFMAHVPPGEVKQVYSHPHALEQCRRWLEQNLAGVERVPMSSTARAVEALGERRDAGAIASTMAGEEYGVAVQAENIQDDSGNATRFVVLGEESGPPTGHDKTSLYFGLQHKAGALFRALDVFHQSGINLLRIESRPSKSKQWEYHFFVDFDGHVAEANVEEALRALSNETTMLNVLGSYPRATP